MPIDSKSILTLKAKLLQIASRGLIFNQKQIYSRKKGGVEIQKANFVYTENEIVRQCGALAHKWPGQS